MIEIPFPLCNEFSNHFLFIVFYLIKFIQSISQVKINKKIFVIIIIIVGIDVIIIIFNVDHEMNSIKRKLKISAKQHPNLLIL